MKAIILKPRIAAYDLFRNGEIKCFRLKNRWKIPKQSVIDYINEKANM